MSLSIPSTPWFSPWGSDWSGTEAYYGQDHEMAGVGRAISIEMSGQMSNGTLEYYGADVSVTDGGLL